MYIVLLSAHCQHNLFIITEMSNFRSSSLSPDNKYIGQVVYEVQEDNREWLMRFIVAKELDALLKVSIFLLSNSII